MEFKKVKEKDIALEKIIGRWLYVHDKSVFPNTRHYIMHIAGKKLLEDVVYDIDHMTILFEPEYAKRNFINGMIMTESMKAIADKLFAELESKNVYTLQYDVKDNTFTLDRTVHTCYFIDEETTLPYLTMLFKNLHGKTVDIHKLNFVKNTYAGIVATDENASKLKRTFRNITPDSSCWEVVVNGKDMPVIAEYKFTSEFKKGKNNTYRATINSALNALVIPNSHIDESRFGNIFVKYEDARAFARENIMRVMKDCQQRMEKLQANLNKEKEKYNYINEYYAKYE